MAAITESVEEQPLRFLLDMVANNRTPPTIKRFIIRVITRDRYKKADPKAVKSYLKSMGLSS